MQLMNLLCSNIMSHLNFVGSSSILKRFTFYCVWHNSNFEYGESYRTDAVAGTLEFCAQREVYSMLAIMMTAHISCVRKMHTRAKCTHLVMLVDLQISAISILHLSKRKSNEADGLEMVE